MRVLAVDPGPVQSGYVIWDGREILDMGISDNYELLAMVGGDNAADELVIEQVCSYGMAVGASVFETVFWSGRFAQAWAGNFHRLPRMDVKMHLCHNSRAKDTNIRQSLIDRFGEPGKKAQKGLLFGVKKDIWAAMGLAVTWFDLNAA